MLSVLLVAVASSSSSLDITEEWHSWKAQHRKSYGSQGEELERHLVWLSNREYINAHNENADQHGYTLALNHFGDLVKHCKIKLIHSSAHTDCSLTQQCLLLISQNFH